MSEYLDVTDIALTLRQQGPHSAVRTAAAEWVTPEVRARPISPCERILARGSCPRTRESGQLGQSSRRMTVRGQRSSPYSASRARILRRPGVSSSSSTIWKPRRA